MVALTAVLLATSFGGTASAADTVPGQDKAKYDQDNNSIPDAGVYVNGRYTAVYAYDNLDDWYQDLGEGRILGTVDSVGELDAETLTVCDYVNNYRADFGNDPYMDHGWIQNHINCSGFDDNNHYNYLIVSDTDPRFTGNPDWAVWGSWEYHNLMISGYGDLTGPKNHVS